MNSTTLILTETQLLSQLPQNSRLVSPTGKVFIKHTNGIWFNWANNACTGRPLQPGYELPDGSQAYLPTEQVCSCYVKHPNGNWLNVQAPRAAFAPNDVAPLQVLHQTAYRSGAVPVDDHVVLFNVPMPAAHRGQVADPTGRAFTGELARQEKASIRFGLLHVESSGYRARQHNLQRASVPIMRGQLAMVIAEEVRLVMEALEEITQPLTSPGGRPVAFEDLVLVDVRRVSRGSLQPTLAVRAV